jgi:hypothetical protein
MSVLWFAISDLVAVYAYIVCLFEEGWVYETESRSNPKQSVYHQRSSRVT